MLPSKPWSRCSYAGYPTRFSLQMTAASEHVVVAGAGICGLLSALSLSKRGFGVTLLERDAAPPPGGPDAAFFEWQRPGAAQFRHPHALLGLLCNLLEKHHPELLDELYAAGARRLPFLDMLPHTLREHYEPEAGDESLWILLCRRATIEAALWRFVAQRSNIHIRNGTQVTGLLTSGSTAPVVVDGLRIADAHGEHELRADVTLDASGRRSRFPRWLAELGAAVHEERTDAEIVYYTRHYRLRPGASEPRRDAPGARSGAGDLGYLKFGVFPGDAGHFAIILCVPLVERELRRAVRDARQFDAICRNIPGLAPWLACGQADPTTEPFGIADIRAVWRSYVRDGQPVALNLFAVGDSAIRTNPLYGRGCSMGMLHSQLLVDTLCEQHAPNARALQFQRRTDAQLRSFFDLSLREDKRGIRRALALQQTAPAQPRPGLRQWLRDSFGDAVSAAARKELSVARGAFRTFHLLEPPGQFLKQWPVRTQVLRYLLRGRRRNLAERLPPGPDRLTLHAALGISAE